MNKMFTPLVSQRKGWASSIFLTLLFLVFSLFMGLGRGGLSSLRAGILYGIALAFSAAILFLIFRTGRIHHWRRIFFSTYAVAFAIQFVWWTMGDRGHMWLLDKEVLYAGAPMCHMVVPMLLLPLVFTKTIIFPTSFSQASFMILLVIVVGIVYGRSFCSWGCFFGGQDELFAGLPRKKRWTIGRLPPFIRYFSYGLLAFIIMHSLATLSPTYCWWFCPFKTSSEFIEVNSFIRVIQTFIFVILWAGLAVILPLLTKKRIQCGLFCPMGAFFSCTARINLFRIAVDRGKCVDCGLCESVCSTFSLNEESLAMGKTLNNCTRCGACIEACPQAAIHFVFPGSKSGLPAQAEGKKSGWRVFLQDLADPATIFVMGIFLVANVIASESLIGAMSRLLRYFFKV
jgi:polyferredoxin